MQTPRSSRLAHVAVRAAPRAAGPASSAARVASSCGARTPPPVRTCRMPLAAFVERSASALARRSFARIAFASRRLSSRSGCATCPTARSREMRSPSLNDDSSRRSAATASRTREPLSRSGRSRQAAALRASSSTHRRPLASIQAAARAGGCSPRAQWSSVMPSLTGSLPTTNFASSEPRRPQARLRVVRHADRLSGNSEDLRVHLAVAVDVVNDRRIRSRRHVGELDRLGVRRRLHPRSERP